MSNKQVEIAVVGAGLLGRLLALLIKDQAQVTLFERGSLNDSKTTGRLAAAMVAPIAESVIASKQIVDMGLHSVGLWNDLLSTLGLHGLYQQAGTLVVSHPNDDADLNHFYQRLKVLNTQSFAAANSNENAAEQPNPVQTLDKSGINQLEPELQNTFNHGLFLANEGHVCNHQLYDQTLTQLLDSDVTIKTDSDVDIDSEIDAALETSGKTIIYATGKKGLPDQEKQKQTFDLVIDCRGLDAKHQLQNPDAKLRGVRGEVIRLRAPEVAISRPVRFMHPRYPIYIVPKPNDEYVIGATEIESEDYKQPSVRSTMELLSAAYSLHKGFAEAEILSIDAGLRPTLMDNEPSITVSNGLIQANGLYRHGYMITPYMLAQILLLINQHGIAIKGFSDKPVTLDESLISRFG